MCSLDLVVFSLLLPRLSTSAPPLCQKTQVSGMRVGSHNTHRRGTATEAKPDDIPMADLPFSGPRVKSEVAQPIGLYSLTTLDRYKTRNICCSFLER